MAYLSVRYVQLFFRDGYRALLVREEQQDLLALLACLDVLVLRDPQDLLERRVHR